MISIVVTVKDAMPHIKNLCHDLSALDWPEGEHLEYIIVDGGSTDGTWRFLQDWMEPAKRLKRYPCNVSEGRNTGIVMARGHHIAITDADFRLPESWITHFHAASKQEPHKTIYAGHKAPIIDGTALSIITASLPINGPAHTEIPATPRKRRWLQTIDTDSEPYAAVTGNAYYPTQAIRKAGGFNEDLEAAEDGELHTRMLSQGCRIHCDSMHLAHHHPRKTWAGLWSQIRGYGRGQAMADLHAPDNLRYGHLLPPLAIIAAALTFMAGFMDQRFWWPLVTAAAIAYVLAGVWATRVAWTYRWSLWPAAFWSWMMWQTIWGWGFLEGIVEHGKIRAQRIKQEALARV